MVYNDGMPIGQDLIYRRRGDGYSVIYGNRLINPANVPVCKDPICYLVPDTTDLPLIGLNKDNFARHTLFMGSVGTGKTNGMFQVIGQLKSRLGPEDIMIIFDTKGDYLDEFFMPGDVIISNDEKACGRDGKANYWNIFREIKAGDSSDDGQKDILEAASTLYKRKLEKAQQPFFPQAARDIFAGILLSFYRLSLKTGFEFNNYLLKAYLDRAGSAAIRGLLSQSDDLKSIVSYISIDSSPQTQGVISELQQGIREIFVGNFSKPGDLSIREMVNRKGGYSIFLEYDLQYGELFAPIFTLIVDQGLKQALGRPNKETVKGDVWVVIDEFRLLPPLQHIDNAINFGRGLGVKVIIAIQNINQVNKIYGEQQANNILSGCSNIFVFRLTDEASRSFAQKIFGKQKRVERYTSEQMLADPMEQVAEGYVIEDSDLYSLRTGSAVIGLPSIPPFLFPFSIYNKEAINKRLREDRAKREKVEKEDENAISEMFDLLRYQAPESLDGIRMER